MTQEEKQILFQDLSARLPYRPKCEVEYKENGSWHTQDMYLNGLFSDGSYEAYFLTEKGSIYSFDYKPYLRPMSDMTEDEKNEFERELCVDIREEDNGRHTETYGYSMVYHRFKDEQWIVPHEAIDWLNKHKFDYRGLIEKGLAIEYHE